MPFEVEFVFLEPGDIEFLARSTALELAGNVLFIIAYNPAGSQISIEMPYLIDNKRKRTW